MILEQKHKAVLPTMGKTIVVTNIVVMVLMMVQADAWDTNPVFDPCSDTKIQRGDGFTFGLAFSMKESFLFNQTQLSPCDQRLSLSQNNAQLAVFRPRVDEISLLTINSTMFNPVSTCYSPHYVLVATIMFVDSLVFMLFSFHGKFLRKSMIRTLEENVISFVCDSYGFMCRLWLVATWWHLLDGNMQQDQCLCLLQITPTQ